MNRMINKLNTKCKNDFCQWKGDLLDFVQDHQKVCKYSLVPCNNLQREKDCLHQIVQCDCCQSLVKKMNKVCIKDATLKHTELKYQSLKQKQTKSIEEISLLKQGKSKCIEEISLLKQENNEFQAKFVELEKQSNAQIQTLNTTLQIKANQINQLKDKSKKSMKELKVLKDKNQQLEDVRKKTKKKVPDKTVKLQEESLKGDLTANGTLIHKLNGESADFTSFSLLNNDSVLRIYLFGSNITTKELSKCYEKGLYYLIDQLGLYNLQNLMFDLLYKIPYHLFESSGVINNPFKDSPFSFVCQGWLCFPIVFHDISIEIFQAPRRFKLNFSKKECLVEWDVCSNNLNNFTLYIGQSQIKLTSGVKVNIEKGYYDQMMKKMGYSDWFGERYACLHYEFQFKCPIPVNI